MRKYSVFTNSQGDFVTVKQGWSWPAFFFGFFWAMAKKMWILGISYFAIIVLISFLSVIYFEVNNIFSIIIKIILRIVFGLCGNIWIENKLFSHGFEIRSVECSRTSKGAIECYKNTIREFSINY